MLIDIAILILALWALIKGWKNGFIKEIISSIGFLAGLLVATLFYTTLGEYLGMDGTAGRLTNVIAFIILWIITPVVLGLVANNLTAALRGMRIGLPNSLLGAAVSLLKYLILMSCVFNVMSILGIVSAEKAATSRLYSPVKGTLSLIFNEAKALHSDEHGKTGDTVWVNFDRTKAEKDTASTSSAR